MSRSKLCWSLQTGLAFIQKPPVPPFTRASPPSATTQLDQVKMSEATLAAMLSSTLASPFFRLPFDTFWPLWTPGGTYMMIIILSQITKKNNICYISNGMQFISNTRKSTAFGRVFSNARWFLIRLSLVMFSFTDSLTHSPP